MSKILAFIDGHKTYIAATGLACLCIYKITQWHLDEAWNAGTQALAVAGIRHAIGKAGQ